MKCGLICARSARTSASISRVREASSSASSSWPETHGATSSAARARPAVGCGREDLERADDALLDDQRADDRRPDLAAAARRRAGRRGRTSGCGRARPSPTARPAHCSAWWWPPRPSQASRPAVSVSASGRAAEQVAQVPDAALGAARGQALAQRGRGQRGVVQRRGRWRGRPRSPGGDGATDDSCAPSSTAARPLSTVSPCRAPARGRRRAGPDGVSRGAARRRPPAGRSTRSPARRARTRRRPRCRAGS